MKIKGFEQKFVGIRQGVPKDAAEALRWLRLAAEQGYYLAQGALGNMYYKGEGVPKNMVEAYAWFNIAAAQSDLSQRLGNLMLQLEKTMTVAQITKAQRRSRDYWKRYVVPSVEMSNQ